MAIHDECDKNLTEAVEQVEVLLRLISKGTEKWEPADVAEWEAVCVWLNQSPRSNA